jgi:phosphoglycolate phosphatase-like HAD superfamily hydrolase
MSLYVFDFDGVLFDTARECLAIAYATRYGMAATPSPATAAAFLANRHWVGPPWQFAVLLELIERGKLPTTTAEFLALATARKPAVESFTERYFATRGELSRDVERWCSVMTAFAPALAAFRALHDEGRAVVLSTRDDASIQKILGHFANLEPVLLPRSGPLEKWQILVAEAERRGLAPGRVFFLDDYAHHAVPAKQRGIAAHLALWGYLGADDLETARASGVVPTQLADLARTIERHEQENPCSRP